MTRGIFASIAGSGSFPARGSALMTSGLGRATRRPRPSGDPLLAAPRRPRVRRASALRSWRPRAAARTVPCRRRPDDARVLAGPLHPRAEGDRDLRAQTEHVVLHDVADRPRLLVEANGFSTTTRASVEHPTRPRAVTTVANMRRGRPGCGSDGWRRRVASPSAVLSAA